MHFHFSTFGVNSEPQDTPGRSGVVPWVTVAVRVSESLHRSLHLLRLGRPGREGQYGRAGP